MTASGSANWTKRSSSVANYFDELNKIDVSKHVEKKGNFSYLSWPYAIGELRKKHPAATWEVCRFNGLPFLHTEAHGCFVEVAVTVEGVRLSQIHPILDARNKPIPIPNAFDINTSLQRALVKAIALHGLGLYIYAGEDLPDVPASAKSVPQDAWDSLSSDEQKRLQMVADSVRAEMDKNGPVAALTTLEEQGLDNDEKIAVWSRFDSKERSSLKKAKAA